MDIFILIAIGVTFLFGFVLLFGAPYLPTLTPQVKTALDLIDLQPGQHLLELGSGDGKVLIAAAKRGITVTGYELNPLLAIISWCRTRRYGKLVTVRCANFWRVTLPEHDAIFVFLLPKFMAKLNKKIIQETSKSVKLVSFAAEIPGKEIAKEQNGLFLYQYK